MPNHRGATLLTISFLWTLVHAPDPTAAFANATWVGLVILGEPELIPFPMPRVHRGLRD